MVRRGVTAGVVLALCATTLTARAAPGHAGAEVGFWAGESAVTGAPSKPCPSVDPNFCPRNTGVYTPALWKALADSRGVLYMNLVYQADFGPVPPGLTQRTDGLALVQQANSLGIPVEAWLTVPLSAGIFPNEEDAAIVSQAVHSYGAWVAHHGVNIREIVLDLEFPLGDQPVADALKGNLTGLEQLMRANIDPAGQCRAMAIYRDTITWAHRHGLRIAGAPVPFALDDLADGTLALQDALDIVAFPPFRYDHLYVQAYRTYGDPGSGYVASYYADMQHYFGASGQVTLGDTGSPPYDKLVNVVHDVRLLAGLGATAIPIFDLDATVKTFGAAGVKAIVDAGHDPMAGGPLAAATRLTPAGRTTRQFFRALDATATALTFAVTASEGHPRAPNAYPDGCGDMRAAPFSP